MIRRLMCFVTVAACFLACAGSDDTAAAGDDVGQTESDSEALGAAHVGSDSAGNPALLSLTGATGGGAGTFLEPPGCVTETNDTATSTATFTYDDCTGPFGLVHITGTVAVVYSSSGPGELSLQLSSSDLAINRATLSSWSATADIQTSGSTRTMAWNASLSGTTAHGRSFTRQNMKTISWTVGASPICISVDGTADGTVTGEHLQTTVKDYQRCQDACPQAGSQIQITNESDGAVVSIDYSGGASAEVSETRNGKTRSVDLTLACGL